MRVKFKRYIDDTSLAEWNEKRMMSWYFENTTGHKVEIEPEDKYSSEKRNIGFVRMVNIVYHGVAVMNISVDSIWKDVKRYKIDWLGDQTETDNPCNGNMVLFYVIERFLDEEENKLKMSEVKGHLYHDKITERSK